MREGVSTDQLLRIVGEKEVIRQVQAEEIERQRLEIEELRERLRHETASTDSKKAASAKGK